MNHLFQVFRYSDNGDSTLSYILYDGKLYAYGLEDEYRGEKVAGETRIGCGMYQLGIKEEITPKTISYRNRYTWFDKHIEVKDVENFTNVYVHVGNFEDNTDGCLLVGDCPNVNTLQRGAVLHSVTNFKRFYQFVYPLLRDNEKVYIEYIDQDRKT